MAAAGSGHRRLLAALIVSVTLMACSGDGDEKVPSAADDRARAQRIVLSEDDLPDLTLEDQDEGEDLSEPFPLCIDDNQVLKDLGDGPRGAETTLSNEDLSVSTAVNLADKREAAEEAFDVLTRPEFQSCFEDTIRSGFEADLGDDGGSVSLAVSKLPVDKQGDEILGYRSEMTLGALAHTLAVTVDFIFLRVGRGVAVMFSADTGGTFDAAQRNRLVGLLVERMEEV